MGLRFRGFCNRRFDHPQGCLPGSGNGGIWDQRDTDAVIGFGLAAETGDRIGCGWTSDFAARAERRQGWLLVRTDLTAQGCAPTSPGCQTEVDDCASNPCSRYSEAGANTCIDADDYFLAIQTHIQSAGQDLPTLSPGYTCTCNEGWTGKHCVSLRQGLGENVFFAVSAVVNRTCAQETDLFADSAIGISGAAGLESQTTMTTETSHHSLMIQSRGTSPLWIESVTTSVPWASVTGGTPGTSPDFVGTLIAAGTHVQLGVSFEGGATGGTGTFTGELIIQSSDRRSQFLSLNISLDVTAPTLAVIALPQQVSAQLFPEQTRENTLTMFNTKAAAEAWTIPDCACNASGFCALNASFLVQVQTWIDDAWAGSCGETMEGDSEGALLLTSTAPVVVESYMHTFYIETARASPWAIMMSLRTETDASLFSAEQSTYTLVVSADQRALDPFSVTVEAADRWGNALETASVPTMLVELASDDHGLEEWMRESVEYQYMALPGDPLYQADGEVGRSGIFRVTVCVDPDLPVGTVPAACSGLATVAADGDRVMHVAPLACEPPRTNPNDEGNICLIAYCDDGEEPDAEQTTCMRCQPGRYSRESNGTRMSVCETCPAGLYAADSGSSSCERCIGDGEYAEDGMRCRLCAIGEQVNGTADGCDQCPVGKAGVLGSPGMCDACAKGKVARDDRVLCEQCPAEFGFTSSDETMTCVCDAGYYSLLPTPREFRFNDTEELRRTADCKAGRIRPTDCGEPLEFCTKCSSLNETVDGALTPAGSWDSKEVCAGGPVDQAFLCPVDGLYIHVDDDTKKISLIRCEYVSSLTGSYSVCKGQKNCNATVQLNSSCADRHRGFLCAECEPGFRKIRNECVVCEGVNWTIVATTVLTCIVIAGMIWRKAIKVVVPVAQAKQVFAEIDADRSGSLDAEEIGELLKRMGDPMAAKRIDKTLQRMTGRDRASGGDTVNVDEFKEWCVREQPSAAFNIGVFFWQTFSMIGHNNEFFGLLKFVQFNVEDATGSCILPVGLQGSILLAFVPSLLSAVFVVLAFVCVRSEERALEGHHLKRALLLVALFAYAPLTRKCVDMIVCRTTVESLYPDGHLMSDMQYECFSARNGHRAAAWIAIVVLIIYGFMLPLVLLWLVRRQVRQQDPLAALKPTCLDELYKKNHAASYWWFCYILILKLGINMLSLFGAASNFMWTLWLQVVLILTALVSNHLQPYVQASDNQLEQVALLLLACVLGIVNAKEEDVEWQLSDTFLIVLIGLGVVGLALHSTLRARRLKDENVRRAREAKRAAARAQQGAGLEVERPQSEAGGHQNPLAKQGAELRRSTRQAPDPRRQSTRQAPDPMRRSTRGAAPAVPAAGLWVEKFSEEHGRPYWVNRETRKSTWTDPNARRARQSTTAQLRQSMRTTAGSAATTAAFDL